MQRNQDSTIPSLLQNSWQRALLHRGHLTADTAGFLCYKQAIAVFFPVLKTLEAPSLYLLKDTSLKF